MLQARIAEKPELADQLSADNVGRKQPLLSILDSRQPNGSARFRWQLKEVASRLLQEVAERRFSSTAAHPQACSAYSNSAHVFKEGVLVTLRCQTNDALTSASTTAA